jgi:hypothetical protein
MDVRPALVSVCRIQFHGLRHAVVGELANLRAGTIEKGYICIRPRRTTLDVEQEVWLHEVAATSRQGVEPVGAAVGRTRKRCGRKRSASGQACRIERRTVECSECATSELCVTLSGKPIPFSAPSDCSAAVWLRSFCRLPPHASLGPPDRPSRPLCGAATTHVRALGKPAAVHPSVGREFRLRGEERGSLLGKRLVELEERAVTGVRVGQKHGIR